MSRLRGRSQNRKSQESCPEDPGAASQRKHFGAAKARPRLMSLLLALITLLVYLPVAHHGFSLFDDDDYVTENHVVQNGLTWAGLQWAFTTWHASNWHPLTWLSHMLDCQLFGLNAGAHHSVNLLFHAANAVLLLGLLFRLTGALWPAALVAALFAWHPLHVESVAWIAERKDVLSTCFALLTLLAYTRYAQARSSVERRASTAAPSLDPRRSTLDYPLALIFFALGLMAKPMLVTLPFVMLLLDYWPLQRFNVQGSSPARDSSEFKVQGLFLEKWPFFLLVVISCLVTFLAQRHGEAVMTLQQFPLNLRIENVLISYMRYLGKTFWPVDLAALYPLPVHWSWIHAMAATAAVMLGVISWLAWRTRRQCPYLLVGWLWFLGTLVPVIGLVQVGNAAMADRYTYFPLIGIFIAITFAVRDLMHRFGLPKMAVAITAVLVLAAGLVLTENQLRYWRDSESLFAHTLAVTKDNPKAHINLGTVFQGEGKLNEALAEYREAARLLPDFFLVYENLGSLLDDMGRPEEALVAYRRALQLKSNVPRLHDGIGIVLVELGHCDEAMSQFEEAARLDPAYPWPHFQKGKVLLLQGRDAEAIDELRKASQIDPNNFQILAYTAYVLATDNKPEVRDGQTALMYAARANVLSDGLQPFVLDALGVACAEMGRFDDAQAAARRAIEIAAAQGQTQNVAALQQRLQAYQNHQPWRESFLSTNPPPKEVREK